MKTRIIVDSTADLMPEFKSRVHTVPLTVKFGDEEFIDGVTIDYKAFYEKLIESDVLPTTSQANPDTFMKEFEKVKEAGDSAVVITLSSRLSGTYQSAMIAAEDFDNIYVVDGGSATIGTSILVELALNLLDEDLSAKEIVEKLKAVGLRAEADTRSEKLGYKIREAQLEKVPYMFIVGDKEKEENAVSVRSRKEGDLGSLTLDQIVAKLVEEAFAKLDGKVLINSIGTTIGSHTGPGTLALFFWGNKREN